MDKPTVAPLLAEWGVKHARGRKWACVWCASSDAMDARADSCKCFSCGRRGDAADVYAAYFGVEIGEALRACGMSGNGSWIYRPRVIRRSEPKKGKKMNPWIEGFSELWQLLPILREAPCTEAGKMCVEYLRAHGVTQSQAEDLPVRMIPDRRHWMACIKRAFGEVPECLRWKTGGMMPLTPAVAFGYRGRDFIRCIRFRQLSSKIKTAAPTGVDAGLFDMTDAETPESTVYICEGEPDTLALAAQGWPVIGTPGASVFGSVDDWEDLLCGELRPKSWVICKQGDAAADRWEEGVRAALYRAGEAKIWSYQAPKDWDIADMVARDKDRALAAIIGKAER